MISSKDVDAETIRRHYQLGTLFYRLMWGPHIHHGLWINGDESVGEAQGQLITKLAELASVGKQDLVLDVGCGMGGSAISLARRVGCDVTGITLSSLQKRYATAASHRHGVARRTRFMVANAEEVTFDASSFDILWSIECTEHLADKEVFFRRASNWLRPGGRVALCVWFEGTHAAESQAQTKRCEEICDRFFCPSLATREEYAGWLADCGLKVIHDVDWTDRVTRTWEICKRRVERSRIRQLVRLLGREQVQFLDAFDTLLDAYRSGAMEYGALVAEKPAAKKDRSMTPTLDS